ncbi:hypothetical protein PIB30_029929 [Stylosanthes scabra]|uniref:Uncharacterized protein n=1 Tax=Stylosanthes scabra TaxID=79078 RepID=A0ABU6UA75_9FABA|nr:hypothetical protein [Stylosanthes scabra]
MRTAMDCAWTLDGAMDNCVYTLSLASRNGWLLIDYVTMCMLEIDEDISTHWLKDFENGLPNRFCGTPSRLHLQDFINCLRSSRFD